MRKLYEMFVGFTNPLVVIGWLSFSLAVVFSDDPILSLTSQVIARVLP